MLPPKCTHEDQHDFVHILVVSLIGDYDRSLVRGLDHTAGYLERGEAQTCLDEHMNL